MEIINLKIEELIPYAKNTRSHNDVQVAQIVASIKEFGFTNPILIDEDKVIIAGHGRVLAAQRLKMAELPCIMLSGLSNSQKRAYRIADNKIALNGSWEEEFLKIELEELKELDFDIDITGFDQDELDELWFENVAYKEKEEKDNPSIMKITFESPEDFRKVEDEIRIVIDKYKVNVSILAGEV